MGGEPHSIGLLLALLAGKILLLAVSFGSGMRGEFFVPAVFIGAMMGALMGTVGAVLSGPGIDVGTFAVVGMAAALAGMVHAPLTAAVALGGMTARPGLLPFLRTASLASQLLARRLARDSLCTFCGGSGDGACEGSGRARFRRSTGPAMNVEIGRSCRLPLVVRAGLMSMSLPTL